VNQLVDGLPGETKLVVLPEPLVEHLKVIARKRGVSLSSFTTEALEQAVKVDRLGASLGETVEVFDIRELSRESGAVQIPRSTFDAMILDLYRDNKDGLLGLWSKTGRWFGEYLRIKLGSEALGVFERALMLSWNLEDVDIKIDGLDVKLVLTSFVMSREMTELMVSYISGAMVALGYDVVEEDYLRGLAILYYRRALGR
jgi:hypothetical protein